MMSIAGEFFSIICTLINAYRPLFIQDTSKDHKPAEAMLARIHESNKLKNYVQKMKYQSKNQLKWASINCDDAVQDFPHFTLEKLNSVTSGIYQLKQA